MKISPQLQVLNKFPVKNYLSIMDDADTIQKKIRSAVTDSEPMITADDVRLGVYNLLTLFHLVTDEPIDQIASRYEGKGTKDFKDDLAEALILHLKPIQTEINNWMQNKDELRNVIKLGSEHAKEVAQKTLSSAKKQLGL